MHASYSKRDVFYHPSPNGQLSYLIIKRKKTPPLPTSIFSLQDSRKKKKFTALLTQQKANHGDRNAWGARKKTTQAF